MIVGGNTVIGYAPWFTNICTRAPRIVPSDANAKSTLIASSRACPAASRFSTRSSIHFTGRASCRAATHTAISSRLVYAFWPNDAADVAAAHRDEVGRVIEERSHRQAQRVRVLVRDVDDELTGVGAEVGEDRAAFERHVGHAFLREPLRHHEVGPANAASTSP